MPTTIETRREKARTKYAENPELFRAKTRKWRKANPERAKASYRQSALKSAYGITLAQKDAMFVEQGSCCAICESPTTTGKGWHVDHCHQTKKIRGVLCHRCNLMIGQAQDNVPLLNNAAHYLNRHKDS